MTIRAIFLAVFVAFQSFNGLAQQPSSPGTIVLDRAWQSPIQCGSATMEDLGVLLSPFAQPSKDTSQAPRTEIYQGVTYLMPYAEAIYQGQ